MEPPTIDAVSDAVALAMKDALSHWRKHYAPGVPMSDLLADVVQSVDVDLRCRRGGRSYISVEVAGRRRFDSEIFFYNLRPGHGQQELRRSQ